MADISITAANVIPSANAQLYRKTLAAASTAGQVVYLDTNGKAALADANASATTAAVYGILVTGGGTNQVATVCTKDPALVIGATVAIGDVLILSATAGGVAAVADLATGHYGTVLGIATSTTAVNFNPVAAGAAKA